MEFTTRLVLLANQNGHPLHIVTEEWTARPVLIQPRQTNGFDCGLWVLSNITAVLSGYPVTGLAEADICTLRHLFLQHLLALPPYIAA